MWVAIRTFFLMVFGNPITKAVLRTATQDILNVGVVAIQASVVAMQEAEKMDAKGTDKLNYVVDRVKNDIQDAPKAVLTNVVTSAYRAFMDKGE